MKRVIRVSMASVCLVVVGLACSPLSIAEDSKKPPAKKVPVDSVALRIESLTEPPSRRPKIYVSVQNQKKEMWKGTVSLSVPEGWRVYPEEQDVKINGYFSTRVAFKIKKGVNTKENSYRLKATARESGKAIRVEQDVVCSTAILGRAKVDGKLKEWDGALPVTFMKNGKKTVIKTLWNPKAFLLMVEVEEDKLIPYDEKNSFTPCDALQISIAPVPKKDAPLAVTKVNRLELLVSALPSVAKTPGESEEESKPKKGKKKKKKKKREATAKCYLLAQPGTSNQEVKKRRTLGALENKLFWTNVTRVDGVTYYRISIPFRQVHKNFRPKKGQEIHFSILVHDPDGTGIRDWGEVVRMFPSQRKRFTWSRWQGAKFGKIEPFESNHHWGLGVSKK